MGAGFGYDKSAPPGGVLLMVQDTGCCVQPSFDYPRPACVSSDSAWNTFNSTVSAAAKALWSDKVQFIAFGLLPLMILPHILFAGMGDGEEKGRGGGMGMIASIAVAALFIAGLFGPKMWTVQQNDKQDEIIRKACSELARACGIDVQYRTMYVGVCKPKGAQPYRAIAIGSSMAMIGGAATGQQMSIIVPDGSGPGSSLQVQAPSGQMVQVTVPPGVSAGQQFTVQVPAVAPVVVTGTVVGCA